jgi:hypothetical protein
MITVAIAGLGVLGVVVWLLAKVGKVLVKIAEVLAAAAVVFLAVWLVVKALVWAMRQVVIYWRTSLTVWAIVAWWHWWGWVPLVIVLGLIGLVLAEWRLVDLASFDAWTGRHLRAWRLRWTLYVPKLPGWLHACGLSIKDNISPVVVAVNLMGRKKIRRDRHQAQTRLPKVLGVKSGASWDEVRVRLVPGQKPEDVDEVARALASARKVQRCQVRELTPNVVSIDFQRRNLLAEPVTCPDLTTMTEAEGPRYLNFSPITRGSVVRPSSTRRLHAELQVTPCSPRCPVWLLYGIQPHCAHHSMTPGHCKGKAHKPEHLSIAGRRVLVSRKWSNKTLDDHRTERGAFVRQLLETAGIRPTHGPDDGPYVWERPAPSDPDVPPRPVLLLHAVAERQRWHAEYAAAQLAVGEPPDHCSVTSDQAA